MEAAAHDALGLAGRARAGTASARPAEVLSSLLAKPAKFKRGAPAGAAAGRRSPDRTRPTSAPATDGAIGRRWTDLESPSSPQWAAMVVGDLVVAVYRIDRWEPHRAHGGRRAGPAAGRPSWPVHRAVTPSSAHPMPSSEERYVGRSVAAYRDGRRSEPGRPTCRVGPTGSTHHGPPDRGEPKSGPNRDATLAPVG